MGREAQVPCTVGDHTETVKALLESKELILRGATIKRRFELAALQRARVQGDALTFTVDGEAVSLVLGAAQAPKWLAKIQAPPPTLAAKLGIGPAQPAAVFGPALDDAELAAALAGATTDRLSHASVLVAAVFSADELSRAVSLHAGMPCKGLWVVYAKGKAAVLGDTAIRTALRAQGYVDNKTSAVSEWLTATRYVRR